MPRLRVIRGLLFKQIAMKQFTTDELLLMASNAAFARIHGAGVFTEAEERLEDKIIAEAQKRPDYREAVRANIEMAKKEL